MRTYIRIRELLAEKKMVTVSPSLKLAKTDICSEGLCPVISQDESFILGYTNLEDKKLQTPPYIVFGDHTECLKYINFKFVQGADGIKIIKVNEDRGNSRYYYYALQCFYNKTGFYERHFKLLRRTFVPALERIEQDRIASILSAYDNLIENNNKRIRLLEQMAENLYREWFVRFRFPGNEKVEMENGLPKGWKVEKVKAIVKRLPFNRTYKEEELEKAGKVVVIDQSTNDVLGYHNNEPSHYADYNSPMIIFGDHSCKFQLMTQNFSLGENVIPFTTYNNSIVNEYWLFYATHKLIKTEEYKRHWGRFSTMKVLIPKIELQNKFSGIIVSIEKEKNKLKAENENLSRQRDLLLPRLMSGKLEVNTIDK